MQKNHAHLKISAEEKFVLIISHEFWGFWRNNSVFINKRICAFKKYHPREQLMMNFAYFQRNNGVFMKKEKKIMHLKNISCLKNSYFDN